MEHVEDVRRLFMGENVMCKDYDEELSSEVRFEPVKFIIVRRNVTVYGNMVDEADSGIESSVEFSVMFSIYTIVNSAAVVEDRKNQGVNE